MIQSYARDLGMRVMVLYLEHVSFTLRPSHGAVAGRLDAAFEVRHRGSWRAVRVTGLVQL